MEHDGIRWDIMGYDWVAQQSVTDKTRDEIALEVQDMSWGTFKPLLAEATVEYLVSVRCLSFWSCSAEAESVFSRS